MAFSILRSFLNSIVLVCLISATANAQNPSDSFWASLAADVYIQGTPMGGDVLTHQQFLEDEVFANYLLYLNTVGLRLAAFELQIQQTKSLEKNKSCSAEVFTTNISSHRSVF